jgi:integrase
VIGLLLGCGLRRSEVATLRLDHLQGRENHCVIADLVGKGGRLRPIPVPTWCNSLIDVWLRGSRVTEGKVFGRVSKNDRRQDAGVTANVVWYAVNRYARHIGFDHLAPPSHLCPPLPLRWGRTRLEQIQFPLGHASVQTTEWYIGCRQNFREAAMTDFECYSLATRLGTDDSPGRPQR